MITQEAQLINAIKALPNHQVFTGHGCIVIARTNGKTVSQRSVWLGRTSTIENLERVVTESFLDKIIVHMGDVWRVIGVGVQRDGNTFCHLISLQNGRQQKNGWVAQQINDWVDTAVLKAAKKGA